MSSVTVRAPELRGAAWINTDHPLSLEELRGRVVLLDFWTFCCVNCLHVIEELRPLEERFGDSLVVIGVHSPKFPHEADHEAVVRAVQRHRIRHPVLDDPGMETWQQYAVRAWPTLVLIDPAGNAVAAAEGEGKVATMAAMVEQLLGENPGALTLGPAFDVPARPSGSLLSFPGKVASDGGGRLAIADTGHDRIVLCDLEGRVLSSFEGFAQPQGVRFDGDRLLVCDTVGDRLVAVDLGGGGRSVLATGVSSPWDVVRLDADRLAVAEAGRHRILSVPAEGGVASPFAGTRAEGLLDGPAERAMLAQPSGLTLLPGGALVFADAEVSALRTVRNGVVGTLVGEGLFEWGSQDGGQNEARLQHPLGVAALPDGSVAVADTFNNDLRLWREGHLSTIALRDALDEPGGLDVLPDGRLVVADTGHHRVVIVDIGEGTVTPLTLADRRGADAEGSAGALLRLSLGLDTGAEALDRSQGPPVRFSVSADPPALLGPGPRSWALDELPAEVELRLGAPGSGSLQLDLSAATCSGDVCTVHRRSQERRLTVV
ncbi:MAG: thioredoxin-like domain-containing protein [Candidatus Dormibacteria bacterium]